MVPGRTLQPTELPWPGPFSTLHALNDTDCFFNQNKTKQNPLRPWHGFSLDICHLLFKRLLDSTSCFVCFLAVFRCPSGPEVRSPLGGASGRKGGRKAQGPAAARPWLPRAPASAPADLEMSSQKHTQCGCWVDTPNLHQRLQELRPGPRAWLRGMSHR